jgi:hypothetical protein
VQSDFPWARVCLSRALPPIGERRAPIAVASSSAKSSSARAKIERSGSKRGLTGFQNVALFRPARPSWLRGSSDNSGTFVAGVSFTAASRWASIDPIPRPDNA